MCAAPDLPRPPYVAAYRVALERLQVMFRYPLLNERARQLVTRPDEPNASPPINPCIYRTRGLSKLATTKPG
jgi:hypothetical protein